MKKNYTNYSIAAIVIVVIIVIIAVVAARNSEGTSSSGTITSASAASSMDLTASSSVTASTTSDISGLSSSTVMNMVEMAMSSTSPISSADDAVLVVGPNGGEIWHIGDTVTISWRVWERHLVYDPYTVSLIPQVASATPIVIAQDDSNLTYTWKVETDIAGTTVAPGSYKMQVCFSGTKVCDMSDYPFTILN